MEDFRIGKRLSEITSEGTSMLHQRFSDLKSCFLFCAPTGVARLNHHFISFSFCYLLVSVSRTTKVMSLHRYFKSNSANRVPTNVIPVAGTIAELMANKQNEVSKAIKNMGTRGEKGKKYKKYNDKKRSEVAKVALNSGVRSAGRRYGIVESTIRGFIKSYKEAKAASDKDISLLPTK